MEGKYVVLFWSKTGLYECSKLFGVLDKASFDVGCSGGTFSFDKDDNASISKIKGLGLYKIVGSKKVSDYTIYFVKFVFRITEKDYIIIGGADKTTESILLDFIYSSKNVIPIESLDDEEDSMKKNTEYMYNGGVISYYSKYSDSIKEFNCDNLNAFLHFKNPDESYSDCAIRCIEEGKIDVDYLVNIFSKPSKMLEYAKHVEEVFDLGLSEAEKEFPLLYHKLSKNYDIFSTFFINDIYDYLIRAHKKYLKYGFEDNAESMEEELKAVFGYEKDKKEKEKAEKKARRKAAKKKGAN